MWGLHADNTFRASTSTRKFETETIRRIRSFSEDSRFVKTATRDKFDESVRLTCFHDLFRDMYRRYVLYARFAEPEEKWCWATKFLRRCFHVIECKKTVTDTEWRKTYNRNAQRTWSSSKNFNATPAFTWDVYKVVLFPFPSSFFRIYFHSFPFIGIIRQEEKSGKSGNNGELPRVDRNGSSLPGKGFSREKENRLQKL